MRRAVGLALVLVCGAARGSGAAVAADREGVPSLARLADGAVDRLVAAFPLRSGIVTAVEGRRARIRMVAAAPGEVLDLYAPEDDGVDPAAAAVSLALFGRVMVTETVAEGAVVEPVPPLSVAELRVGQLVKPRGGPRRIGIEVVALEGSGARVAAAVQSILPERLRAHGFLPIVVEGGAHGSLLADRDSALRTMQARDLEHLLRLTIVVAGGRLEAYGELASNGGSPVFDLFSVTAPVDVSIVLLLGEPSRESPGLSLVGAAPLPGRPLTMEARAGRMVVLTHDALLFFRVDGDRVVPDGTVPLPADLPPASVPVRDPAGCIGFAARQGGDAAAGVVYIMANWLGLAYRVVPIGAGGALESVPYAPIAAAPRGGFVTASWRAGTNALEPELSFHEEASAATKVDVGTPVQRVVAWEGRHYIALTDGYELVVVKPGGEPPAPLTEARRTGYAFDVAYDEAGARTVIAASSMATGPDRVTIETLLPPERTLARVDLPGVAEAVLLDDVDADGRLELLVAEGVSVDGKGLDRLLVFRTDLLVGGAVLARP